MTGLDLGRGLGLGWRAEVWVEGLRGRSLNGYGRQGQPQGTLTRIQSSLGSVLFRSCWPWWLVRDETHLVKLRVRVS